MLVAGRRARRSTGVTAIVQNAEHYTYFHDRPIDLADGRRRSTAGRSPASCSSARAVLGVPSLLVRALTPRLRLIDHRQVAPFTGARRP